MGYNTNFEVIFSTYKSCFYRIAWIVNTACYLDIILEWCSTHCQTYGVCSLFFFLKRKFPSNLFSCSIVKKRSNLRYQSQREAPLHNAIEVLSQARLVLVTPRASLDLAAAKRLYQSLLLSPKLSEEGASFLEVSNGKRYRGVSR